MSPTSWITCRELVELVTAYLEGVLPEVERARFEQHLDLCGHCRAHVEQMRVTLTVVGRIDAEDLDPELERGLFEAFRRWQQDAGGAA